MAVPHPDVDHPPANAMHQGLGRCELFDFAPDRLSGLREALVRDARPFSIHSPLCRPSDFPHPAVAVFYLSPEPAQRETSFRLIEATLEQAGDWGAEYVVTHLNWMDDAVNEDEAERLAHEAAWRLTLVSERYRVPVHVECGGYTGGFHRPEQFAALVGHFPNLGLCLDIGHLWLIARTWGRSFFRDLQILTPYAGSVHLWNTKDLSYYRQCHHVPLHPSQRPEEGWIDVEQALKIVLEKNPECPLIFEYTWAPSEEMWVREGMAWVDLLASGYKRGARFQH